MVMIYLFKKTIKSIEHFLLFVAGAKAVLMFLLITSASFSQETKINLVTEGETSESDAGVVKEAEMADDSRSSEESNSVEKNYNKENFQTQKTFSKQKSTEFSIPLKVDGLYTYMSLIQVSDIPQDRPPEEVLFSNELGMNNVGGVRFRLSPTFVYKDLLQVVGEADLLLYPFGDSPEGVGLSNDYRTHNGELKNWKTWFNPRQLYLQVNLPVGIVRVGQMGSNWGMGILANDGSREPGFGTVFGGDITERILFATKPFYKLGKELIKDFTVAVAGDLVFDDITAKLYEGDIAWQGVFALRWPWKGQTAGFYFVYRNQHNTRDETLEVFVFDGHLQFLLGITDTLHAFAEAEAVYITGKTTLARSIHQLKGHDVRQFGSAGRIGLKWLEAINISMELGYASGDANTYDSSIHSFTMDPNYKIGLILFPEVLAWQSARCAELAASDEITGEDNPGINLLPTNGGVSGAFYFNPVLRILPVKWLEVDTGVVLARASNYIISPWEQKNMGAPAGYLGGSVYRRNLGLEADWAVWFKIPVRYFNFHAGVEAGYFWPGEYFTTHSGKRMDDVWLISGRIKMNFE